MKHCLFLQVTLYLIATAVQMAVVVFLCLYLHSLLSVWVGIALIWVEQIAVIWHILRTQRPAEVTAGALSFCLVLPVVGALVCLLTPTITPLPPYRVANKVKSCTYFSEGAGFLQALLHDVDSAQKSIDLDYFIVSYGIYGHQLHDGLISAVKRGVRVRIIGDGVGCAYRWKKAYQKVLICHGVKIKNFHRIRPYFYSALNVRDHKKVAVIDGKIGYLGGANVGDEYANLIHPCGKWKDSAVRITGACVTALQRQQDELWQGHYLPLVGTFLSDTPPYCRGLWERELLHLFYTAKTRIWVMTPYLLPTYALTNALLHAVSRGVDVRVLIPAIPDKKVIYILTKGYAHNLAQGGVTVYAYTPGFLHAKNILCDDTLLCGSYNLDFRSAYFNHECCIRLSDPSTVRQGEQDFLDCWQISHPLPQSSSKDKWLFTLLRPFAPLL